ncbi:MAG: peptidoglycan DD-metalloendopeptidase family protein, partial [Alteraurantiacibacter sp.]
ATTATRRNAPSPYILPVSGRTLTGFGAPQSSGLSQGLTLGPISGAQVVAPAAGRIAFAGPYRGYGNIVIIEHGGGWTSLVTGLARSNVEIGETVVGGAPLGSAAPARPRITLELRRDGEPVNPLLHTQ